MPVRHRRNSFQLYILVVFAAFFVVLGGGSGSDNSPPGRESWRQGADGHDVTLIPIEDDTSDSSLRGLLTEEDDSSAEECRALPSTRPFSLPYVNLTKTTFPSVTLTFGRQNVMHMSLAAWIWMERWPSADVEWCIVSHGSWDHRFKFSVTTVGHLLFTVHLTTGAIYDFELRRSLQPKHWYHVGATFDGTNGRIVFFLNGLEVLQSPREVSDKLKSPLNPTTVPLTIGRCVPEEPKAHAIFKGLIAGVKLWSKVLQVYQLRSAMYWNDGIEPRQLFESDTKGGGLVFDAEQYHPRLGKSAVQGTLTKVPELTWGAFEPSEGDILQNVEVLLPVTEASWMNAKTLITSVLLESTHQVEAKELTVHVIELEKGAAEAPKQSCFSLTDSMGVSAIVRIHIDRTEQHKSWSVAMNHVMEHTKAPWLVIADPHLQVTTGWLRELRRNAVEKRTHAVVPRVLYPTGNVRSTGLEFRFAPTVEDDEPLPYDRLRGVMPNYRPSILPANLIAFDSFCALIDTEAARKINGWKQEFEPRFHMADFALRLADVERKSGKVGGSPDVIRYAPRSSVFYVNPRDQLTEDALVDYMVSDEAMRLFLQDWRLALSAMINANYKSRMRTKWIMHCGGSQGYEATFLVRGLEEKAPVRTSIRRFHKCEAFDTIGKLPATYRESIERTRMRTFPAGKKDEVIVYHRDYRELGLWVEQPRSQSYVVGRYMFETDGLHNQWVVQCRNLHEIWVPSAFHVEVFNNSGVPREKLFKVPEALDIDYYDERIIEPMHIPNRKGWVFLAVFKLEERKGWKELIKAYFQEFTSKDDVMLYIHTHVWNAEGDKFDGNRIKRIMMDYAEAEGLIPKNGTKSLPCLEFTGRYLSSLEILQLFRGADAYVLPTHGEGWGLPYHEAMALGKPTIGTAWGGNTEFMNEDVAYMIKVEQMIPSDASEVWLQGFKWAEPSVPDLRRIMRNIYNNPNEARERGKRAHEWIKTHFSVDVVGDIIADHLARIEREQKLPVAVPAKVDISMASGIDHDLRVCMARYKSRRTVQEDERRAVPKKSDGTFPRLVFLSTFPPRMCGVGRFSYSLLQNMHKVWTGGKGKLPMDVVAMVYDVYHEQYDPTVVKRTIRRDNLPDYYKAAEFINKNYDVLLIQHEFALFGGTAGNLLVCMLQYITIPIVTTLHTIKEDLSDSEHTTMKLVVEMSRHVIVMNELSTRYLDVYHALQPQQISVIHHGVPVVELVANEPYKEQFSWPTNSTVMLSFGLINPGKGLDYVIDALPAIVKVFPSFLFVIAGQPHPSCGSTCATYIRNIQSKVQALKLGKNVQWIARSFSDEEVISLVKACDLFITAYPEASTSSSGTASLAMSAGRVVISTPYTWARDALRNDRGLYIPFQDSTSISKVVLETLTNPTHMKQIAKNAYDGSRGMTWPVTAASYLKVIYSSVLRTCQGKECPWSVS